ncbi:MAG TPA: hypothetical protein VEW68_07450 [Patescibacteria group bacterium]|nr:hypothetical protein [Patescibacteria group bacterium]
MFVLLGVAAFVIVVSAVGAWWRTRPQVARPRTEARFAFFVLVLAAAGVMATGPHLGPAVIAAAPAMMVAGWMLGRALRGTLNFWTEPATGRLMFSGGAVYFVILAISAMGRLFIRFALTGSVAVHSDPSGAPAQAVMVLAGALLFMDTGLYFARAQAIARAAGERIQLGWFRFTGQA